MKVTPPRSRMRCTHPSSTASAPTSSARSAPQVCVRVRSPSCSATQLPPSTAGSGLSVSTEREVIVRVTRDLCDRALDLCLGGSRLLRHHGDGQMTRAVRKIDDADVVYHATDRTGLVSDDRVRRQQALE